MTPTKAEQLAARTSPVHQPAHGWTDADADAARLALELECILTDRDTPMPLTSRWWESAHEALALHRQRIDDELREIECPPDPDAVDRALDADALRADAERWQMLLFVDADHHRPPGHRQHSAAYDAYNEAFGAGFDRTTCVDAAIDAAMKGTT